MAAARSGSFNASISTPGGDGLPEAVGLGLVVGDDLERKRLIVLDRRTAVEAYTRQSHHRELDNEHVTLLTRGIVARGTVNRPGLTVGKSARIKIGGLFSGAVIPEANCILGHSKPPFVTRKLYEHT